MLTRGAIGNLVNRYKAVLRKCGLINVFGSLVVAAGLVLGCVGSAVAEDFTNYKNFDKSTDNIAYTPYCLLSDGPATQRNVFNERIRITGGTHGRMSAIGVDGYESCNNITYIINTSYKEMVGGYYPYITSTYATKGNLSKNTAIVEQSTLFDVCGVFGVNSNSEGNTLIIKKGISVADCAMGASHNGSGEARNNIVIVKADKNDLVKYILGARMVNDGSAFNNKVYMYEGLTNIIVGGESAQSEANGNEVYIYGGTITESVYGGNGSTSAMDNLVEISGAPEMENAIIYGGEAKDGCPCTGNTLRVKTHGLKAKNIHNFEKMEFFISDNIRSGDTILELSDDKTDIDKANVNVTIERRTQIFKKGDRIHLLENKNGVTGDAGESTVVQQGLSVEYTLAFEQTSTTLDLKVVGAEAASDTKSFLEGRIACLAFVNQGAELIAERGISAAREAALEGELVPFMTAQGGKSRYDTGSYVDVRGFSLMAGLALTKPTELGEATVAAFFESGWGNYDSHNSFSNAASVDADGDNSYYGGGLLAHMDFAEFGPGHAYAEASLRAGWAETDYNSSDMHDASGNSASYDSGSAYYGAHLGVGYEWKLTDVSALDVYAKCFWTHQSSDDVRVAGEPISFDSADSHRVRLGARYEYEFSTSGVVLKPFVGAAYEYEFDGEVAGTAYDFAIDKPELKGSTGIGEVGVTFQPSEGGAFALDLGVQGYTGVREGVTGSFTLKYKF